MATTDQISQLKLLIGDTELTDDQLATIIDSEADIQGAAAQAWQVTAAQYADLVNISEAGSSRSLGQLHQNALDMAKYYRGLSSPTGTEPGAPRRTVVRSIERT